MRVEEWMRFTKEQRVVEHWARWQGCVIPICIGRSAAGGECRCRNGENGVRASISVASLGVVQPGRREQFWARAKGHEGGGIGERQVELAGRRCHWQVGPNNHWFRTSVDLVRRAFFSKNATQLNATEGYCKFCHFFTGYFSADLEDSSVRLLWSEGSGETGGSVVLWRCNRCIAACGSDGVEGGEVRYGGADAGVEGGQRAVDSDQHGATQDAQHSRRARGTKAYAPVPKKSELGY